LQKLPHLEASQVGLERFLKDLKFDSQNSLHLLAIMLACEGLEIGSAIIELSGKGCVSSQLILVRQLYESAVRLKYLSCDPVKHGKTLQLMDAISRKKGIEAMVDRNQLLESKLTETKARIDGFKVEKIKEIKIEGMVRLIGWESSYQIYRLLSSSSHQQETGLLARHFKNNKGVYEISVFGGPSADEQTIINQVSADLVNSISPSLEVLFPWR
jgi:Family of unknown function (DUF5677)